MHNLYIWAKLSLDTDLDLTTFRRLYCIGPGLAGHILKKSYKGVCIASHRFASHLFCFVLSLFAFYFGFL